MGGPLLFFSMGVIATGNGLFKANPNNLVSRLYEGEPSKLDGAFTMYYMAINVGAFLSQSLTPWIRVHYGWHWAFLACCAGAGDRHRAVRAAAAVGRAHRLGSRTSSRCAWIGWLRVIVGALVLSVLIAFIIQSVEVARGIVWLSGDACCSRCLGC